MPRHEMFDELLKLLRTLPDEDVGEVLELAKAFFHANRAAASSNAAEETTT